MPQEIWNWSFANTSNHVPSDLATVPFFSCSPASLTLKVVISWTLSREISAGGILPSQAQITCWSVHYPPACSPISSNPGALSEIVSTPHPFFAPVLVDHSYEVLIGPKPVHGMHVFFDLPAQTLVFQDCQCGLRRRKKTKWEKLYQGNDRPNNDRRAPKADGHQPVAGFICRRCVRAT